MEPGEHLIIFAERADLGMNERAFNLFTALLALILIVLTSTLLSSMIQSESNTKTIISKLMSQSKLESMSRLIRADAFQTFKYMMTDQIEEWLSKNEFTIGVDHKTWEDWEKVKEEFTNVYFKDEQQFASFLGENLPSQLVRYNDEYAGGYYIEVDFNREGFVNVLQEVVTQSAADQDFFEIVECDGTPQGCPNGSFYIKLEFSKLDQRAYETMPLLTVRDLRTGSEHSSRELKDPVIPRNDLKVFVPLRLFRALAITRGFMHSELGSGQINSSQDKGFYSPRVHNEFDSLALGFCDYGFCAPRTNPYFPPSKTFIDSQKCPGFLGASPINVQAEFRGENFSYNAGSENSMETKMRKIVKKRMCELSRDLLKPYNDPEFEIKKTTFEGEDCYIDAEDMYVEMDSTLAKKIEQGSARMLGGGPAPQFTVNDEPNHFESASPKCPFNYHLSENRRIGVFTDPASLGELKMPGDTYGAEACEEFGVTETHCGMISPGMGSWSCCTELRALTFVIEFQENNPAYKVNKDRDVKYRIRTFNKSYTPFNPNYDFGGLDVRCALNPGTTPTKRCDSDGWKCYVPPPGQEGCYPARGI